MSNHETVSEHNRQLRRIAELLGSAAIYQSHYSLGRNVSDEERAQRLSAVIDEIAETIGLPPLQELSHEVRRSAELQRETAPLSSEVGS